MSSRSDTNDSGVPRWAGPWAAGWSGMQRHLPSADQRTPARSSGDNGRPRLHTLPPRARRRIQRIGVAASSFAATVWLLGAAWVLQVIG